jgi:hypothetical protein
MGLGFFSASAAVSAQSRSCNFFHASFGHPSSTELRSLYPLRHKFPEEASNFLRWGSGRNSVRR